MLAVILTGAMATATTTAALTRGFQQSFAWTMGFTVTGMLISLALPGRLPDQDRPLPQAAAATDIEDPQPATEPG